MLKKIFIIFALFFIPVSEALAINWVHDYTEALKAAQSSGKPVMIDFATEWCGWCKKLDKDTYSDSKVSALADNIICLKIDGDKERGLTKQYGISGYPTIVFLDSGGKIIETVVGYRDAAAFLEIMQKIAGSIKKAPPPAEIEKERTYIKPKEEEPDYEDYLVYKGFIGMQDSIKALINYRGEKYTVGAGDDFEGYSVIEVDKQKLIIKKGKGKKLTVKINKPVKIE